MKVFQRGFQSVRCPSGVMRHALAVSGCVGGGQYTAAVIYMGVSILSVMVASSVAHQPLDGVGLVVDAQAIHQRRTGFVHS